MIHSKEMGSSTESHGSTIHVPLHTLLAFMWATSQAFRMCPVERRVFIENLEHYAKESDYPRLDVFICTADPYKEPPMCVVNTALSVMAYDYQTEKLSVYVSDDGGSKLTLFAFMEAARVENVVQEGTISRDYMTNEGESEAFSRWTDEFTPQNHPPVVQVLLEHSKDKDVTGHTMPNLVYVSRGKSMNLPHNFKAGALNVLLRVSATMTNAPVILTLDTDMYSNDPQTPVRMLCYLLDPGMDPKLGYWMLFQARSLLWWSIRNPELNQDHLVNESINSKEVLAMAHHVADCNFEKQTKWGTEMGLRYGSLVEDFYTGYLLQCKGWKSIFCNPKRPAFLGNSPINLHSILNQIMRWSVGLLEVAFCRYSPITFGVKSINPLTGLCYAHFAFWSIWSIPITIYAFVPQLALLNYASIFPKMLLAGFAIVNCWPLYEAMVLRTDEGKMPVKITLISITLAWALYLVAPVVF
ncbi:Cellulose synthase-like protein G3 [Vitis vinifera]|uniref:Cellulose synthase-like protein G3 n=1 Tax=Vitis vinifera TaxID=29760 RepID=A0A438J583_VITVI|nr:Cellulose synthase-like protein G3 [Vitis vinifera]